tara:strand:+ start:2812 stop:3426 length:615 start_codon:yes stop_codon:yes gene_type:complete
MNQKPLDFINKNKNIIFFSIGFFILLICIWLYYYSNSNNKTHIELEDILDKINDNYDNLHDVVLKYHENRIHISDNYKIIDLNFKTHQIYNKIILDEELVKLLNNNSISYKWLQDIEPTNFNISKNKTIVDKLVNNKTHIIINNINIQNYNKISDYINELVIEETLDKDKVILFLKLINKSIYKDVFIKINLMREILHDHHRYL